jgi:hypothetical protein
MLVLLQLVGVAGTPLKVTVLLPWVAPKPLPVIVTDVPVLPLPGEIVAFETIVKATPLLAKPVVTTTLPLPGVTVGVCTTMLLSLQLMGVIVKLFHFTELTPWLAPKLAPVIVTGVPGEALLSESDWTVGPGVKDKPLLTWPPTVTTTLPLVDPLGTVTPMLVSLQLLTVAGVPAKVTVLAPCELPKLLPEIATVAPTAPMLLLKLDKLGGGTVNCIPLLA